MTSPIVTTASADLSKVETTVKNDINSVETTVKADLAKTYTGKVLLLVGAAALVVGVIIGLVA